MRGRACLKQKLAAQIKMDPVPLPYKRKILAWLREQKAAGRKIILATASDFQMAKPVADHVGIFDEVLAQRRQNQFGGAEISGEIAFGKIRRTRI